MFENLVHQDISNILTSDIKKRVLPGSILFSGSEASGKLTAALETARILSCCNKENPGKWTCTCSSCLQHKSLICSNLMLLGPRDCFLEISAAKEAFLNAVKTNAQYLTASRYLFLRSVRKLTLRFNSVLLKNDNHLSKIGSVIEEINDCLEKLDFPRELPELDALENIFESVLKQTNKLENDFLYDSIPVNQIRNVEEWAHIKSEEGKKTIIIENADRMAVSVRNALLKILEEPPKDCVFILLTTKRNAIMQTILSRVRTYNFITRNPENQKEVISRVFHKDDFTGSINEFLLNYLPVSPDEIKRQSDIFYESICHKQIPDIPSIVKNCEKFNLRIELKIFLNHIACRQRKLMYTQKGAEASTRTLVLLRECWDNVTLYNQSTQSAVEKLFRDLSLINVSYDGVFEV